MPERNRRVGFGETRTEFAGWRDKAGVFIRPGPAVYNMACYAEWGSLPAGRTPVRLHRAFKWKGDKLGKYRLEAEYTWCLNYHMLKAVDA